MTPAIVVLEELQVAAIPQAVERRRGHRVFHRRASVLEAQSLGRPPGVPVVVRHRVPDLSVTRAHDREQAVVGQQHHRRFLAERQVRRRVGSVVMGTEMSSSLSGSQVDPYVLWLGSLVDIVEAHELAAALAVEDLGRAVPLANDQRSPRRGGSTTRCSPPVRGPGRPGSASATPGCWCPRSGRGGSGWFVGTECRRCRASRFGHRHRSSCSA